MKTQRVAIGLCIVNMFLLIFLLAQIHRTSASEVVPVLRGRALEIVDENDRIRAQILTHAPETVNGKTYPGAVLFRMATEDRAPLMKLTVTKDGTTMGLSDDSAPGGVELRATREKGTYVKVVSRDGKEQTFKP